MLERAMYTSGLRIAIPVESGVLGDCTSPTLVHLGDHPSGRILICCTLEIPTYLPR
jgi:hypothetical protein